MPAPPSLVRANIVVQLLVNTLTLTTPTLDPLGLCFDPLLSRANHSCTPNSFITFSGSSANLRTLIPITAGEEITLPYVDTTFPTPVRQQELKERWFFDCHCELCAGAPASAMTDQQQCPECGATTPPPICVKCSHPLPVLPDSNDLAALYQSGLLPPTRQPIPSLHAATVQHLLASGDYAAALPHQLLLVTRLYPALYPYPHHPLRVAAAFVLAALLVEVSRTPGKELAALGVDWAKAVWAVLQQVQRDVVGSHGSESTFARVVREKMAEVREELESAPGVTWIGGDGKVEGIDKELQKVHTVVDGLTSQLKGKK
jgi:hypothetical protein